MVSKIEEQNPRELEAGTYLEKHRVLDLLDNMTSMLIFGRPDDPKTFLIQQLEKLKIAKQSGMYYPCLFDDSNLTSIFGMLDPTKRGFITREQFVEGNRVWLNLRLHSNNKYYSSLHFVLHIPFRSIHFINIDLQ
ncbi:EF-hand calcium-binding domain-containing protein 10-like isoform X2 [Ciona intestinalis]